MEDFIVEGEIRDPEAYLEDSLKGIQVSSVLDVGTGPPGVFHYHWWQSKPLDLKVCLDIRQIRKDVVGWEKMIADAKFLPFKDRSFDHVQCFPKGTYIFGCLKPIEELKAGDMVIGLMGKNKVAKIFSRNYAGDLIALKVLGLPEIMLTPDHPVLTTGLRRVHRKSNPFHVYEYIKEQFVWKKAEELSNRDWVVIPRIKISKPFFLRIRSRLKGIGARKSHGKNEVDPYSFEDRREFKSVKVDYEVAKILGLWVAEGTVGKDKRGSYRVVFSFGRHETELAEMLCMLIKKKLDLHSHSYLDGIALKVMVSNKDLALFLINNFGKRARHKKIPDWLYLSDEEVIRGFIEGWWLGDGDLNKDITMRIFTTSKRLALGSLMLLYKIGAPPSIYYDRNTRGFTDGKKEDNGAWCICINRRFWLRLKDGRKPFLKSRVDENFVYLPITNVRRKHYDGVVFNIETEDHTYSVPFLVHNCTEMLEHVPQKDHIKILRELKRVAKKTVYITSSGLKKHLGEPQKELEKINPFQKYHKVVDRKLLEEEGFRILFYWKKGELEENVKAVFKPC